MGDGKTPLGAVASEGARRLLLRMAANPDPRKDPPVGPGFASVPRDNMRGLAAMGLIRLYARTRDASLPAAIEGLSADGIGRVRAGMACELELLFDVDPSLAGRMTTRYSSDRNPRVLSWMRHPLIRLAGIDGAAALAAAENILSLGAAALAAAAADAVPALLFLSLQGKSRPALEMLRGALADAGLPREIRLMAAHLLGPHLSDPDARGGALELYSLLLDSGDPKTRNVAARCLTDSAADADPGSLAGEMRAHLDKMARSDRGGDRETLETLTAFLRDHWHRMPEQALGHLERVADLPESPHLRHVMTDAVEALNGLLRILPGEDNRRRCLSVLDRFAAAGWSPALKLLRAMERPD